MTSLLELAERIERGNGDATIRFSECVVPGRKGYEWGAVMSTSPAVTRLLCDVWNNRLKIAAALRSHSGEDQ